MRASNLFVGGIIVAGSCNAFAPILHGSKRTSQCDCDRGVSFRVSLLSTASDNNIVGDDITTTTIESLSKCTVPELKDLLRSKGLKVGGKKSLLIERLNDYYLSQTPIVNQQDVKSSIDIVEVQQDSDIEQDQNQSSEDTTLKSTDVTDGITIVEDLSKLTVPALKDRLRDFGLPVGGKKSLLIERLHTAMEENVLKERLRSLGLPVGGRNDELLERLQEASFGENHAESEIHVANEDHEDEGIDIDYTNEDTTLLNLIDDILDDMDIDEEGEDVAEDEFTNEQLNLLSGERSSARRARRKKYWKAQEVRELLKSNDPRRAAAKAEEMISSLEKMAEAEDDVEYLPSEAEYTLLIEAYAHIGTYEGVQRAEAVIDRILDSSNEESNAPSLHPTAKMLNALISAWAAIGTAQAAEKATALLEKMEYMQEFGSVKPTVHSYSIAISAWGKCQNEVAAENAELILNRLFENYDNVLQNDQEESGYVETLKPNGIVFNSVIDAWANSGSVNAGDRAEALLHRMEVLSRLDEYDVRPDTISFNTCIKAWCNSSNRPDAPMKAEEVLSKLEMNPNYPKRAGGVLTVRPNKLSYNTVIHSWAKSQLPESAARAEGLLLRMVKSFKSEAFANVKPDAHTFSSVLNALAKSTNVRNKAEKCSFILKAMIDLDDGSYDTMPNIICYNTVLNACAFSAHGGEVERRQALAVAVEIFNQMRQGKYVTPDAVTYGNMLKCCANLMPPGNQRNAMASRLFTSCCDAGMVGGMGLDEIRRCVPPRAFLPLLADCGYDKPIRQRRKAHSVELKELPREWTINVKRGDMLERQRASFAKPKGTKEHKSRRQHSKKPKQAKPVIRRPGLLFEYGASGRDM